MNIDQRVVEEVARRNRNFYPVMTTIMEDDPRNSKTDRMKNRLAVGEVIRKRSAISGASPTDVSLFPAQFSGWNLADENDPFENIDSFGPKRVAQAYDDWDRSATTNYSKGATHFYNPNVSKPDWRKIGKETARIGIKPFMHIFRKAGGFPTKAKRSTKEIQARLIKRYQA